MAEILTPVRRQILDFISASLRERNFPPTIREICEHVGAKSPATVQKHVQVLKDAGYLQIDSKKSRTLTVHPAAPEPAPIATFTPLIPFVGDVAAGTGVLAGETTHELMAIPEQFAGRGESFVLQVRGESMIEAGIMPGDFLVVNRQVTANTGEIVVAGIPGEEATVKRYFPQGSRVVLKPENSALEPMDFAADEVAIFGRVISVLRSY
jgi:repressor LexA